MKSTTAARRYARALFSLAKDDHRVPDIRAELEALRELLDGSAELRDAVLTPLHPVAERKAVLHAIAVRVPFSPLFKNFISFLVDQRRLVDFDTIHGEFQRLADEAAGLLTARVISSSPLDDRRKDRLRRALSERTGREVKLEIELDPNLIGGAIAQVGDLIFDGSIRTQLSQLHANLMKGS